MEEIYFYPNDKIFNLMKMHNLHISNNYLHNRYTLTHFYYLQGKLCEEERKTIEHSSFLNLYLLDDFQLYEKIKEKKLKCPIFNHITLIKTLIFNRFFLPSNIRPELLNFFV